MSTEPVTALPSSGSLARAGFADTERARRLLGSAVLAQVVADPRLLVRLSAAASPDAALIGLVRLLEACDEPSVLLGVALGDSTFAARLFGVLGLSDALSDHLARHPDHWRVLLSEPADPGEPLRSSLLRAVGARPEDAEPMARPGGRAGLDALRVAYRRAVLHLAGRDLAGEASLELVAAELADLAAAALEAALAIARADLPDGATPCRLAVLAMGKAGGRELNYVSDVDVIFVAEPALGSPPADEQAALGTATKLAAGLTRACSETTAEGTLWPVDAALRPEGKAGPLVRTLASHVAYYQRWAQTWEFQALLKARAVAGDAELARAYLEALQPMVWEVATREGFVDGVQTMRRRVEDTLPAREASRQLKLGKGGLRDVEFAVQLLQLVHGRTDPALRSPSTLPALEALSQGGYVGREDAARLADAYRFLRTLEHRLQLHRLRRTHVVPEAPEELRRLGRSLGFVVDPVTELTEEWHRHAREVRRLHERLFYSPLLQAVARLSPGETRLAPEAARARLEALGYRDPTGALRHLEALTAGVSRRAAIQRTLLPAMLGWFADAGDPDAGLAAFRTVSEALGTTPWYLRLLRDEGVAAQRMATVLAAGRYSADLLLRAPEAVAMLGDSDALAPRPGEALLAEALAAAARHADPVAAATSVRAVRRRELFRTSVADMLGMLDVDAVGLALSSVARATVAGGLSAAVSAIEGERRSPLPTRLAVIGMGRFGGDEMSYASDADVLLVHDPLPGADDQDAHDAAHAVFLELRRLLALPAPDPPLLVDADLRPEGRQGPLVRTLGSYAAYYARWSHVWESQALLRAAPVAGDDDLAARFLAVVYPLRYPEGGIDESAVREIRRIKARVESERLPRGADRTTHLKLGRGGIADVEWTVQLLQLRHAFEVPGLRTTRTIAALEAAGAAGLIDEVDVEVLAEAWRRASRLRDAVVLVRGRPADSLPTDVRDRVGVARLVGYSPSERDDLRASDLVEDYRRTTRRARAVVERVFYGQ